MTNSIIQCVDRRGTLIFSEWTEAHTFSVPRSRGRHWLGVSPVRHLFFYIIYLWHKRLTMSPEIPGNVLRNHTHTIVLLKSLLTLFERVVPFDPTHSALLTHSTHTWPSRRYTTRRPRQSLEALRSERDRPPPVQELSRRQEDGPLLKNSKSKKKEERFSS